jgi:hypothetical protein
MTLNDTIETGSVYGNEMYPTTRVVRVNRDTVTIENWDPIRESWYTPQERFRRIEKGNFLRTIRQLVRYQ